MSRITRARLEKAFALATRSLQEEKNLPITQVITNEVAPGVQEGVIRAVIARALHDVFHPQGFVIKVEYHRIDICVVDGRGRVAVAIECKMMMANSIEKIRSTNPLDVSGIESKMDRLEGDISGIQQKLEKGQYISPHYEIFIPIVYELYRTGGKRHWMENRKPWTTLKEFKKIRSHIKREFKDWFRSKYSDQFKLLHSTNSIQFLGANELWQEQSGWYFPEYRSLEAYVSFLAFGRCVD